MKIFFSKVVSSQISHGSDIKEALQRGILQVYSSYKINWDDLQDSLKLQRLESSYPSIYPAYLQIIEGFDTIPYTYQRDAAYFTYLVQKQNENKLAINSMFLNCSNEGSDCLTVNISEDFIREALKHFMSFGSIVDWEERLSWLSSYVKNTNNIVETAWLNDIIVEVGKTVLQSKLYRAIISTTNELLEGIKLSFLSNVDDDHVYNLIHLLYNHVPFLQNNDELCARVSAVIQRLQNSTAISLWHKLLVLTKNFKLY